MPIAVVTGASSPIGQAIVAAFAHRGFDVVGHAFRAEGDKGSFIRADLATSEGQEAFCAEVRSRVSHIDVLVHNAACYEESTIQTLSREQWRTTMALNVEAPLFITQALLPLLRASMSPSVVNLTDCMASRVQKNYFAYAASKAMLNQLTLTLAAELAPQIRVNAVAPGVVTLPEGAKGERILNKIPLGRVATPEEIARAVTFLACDAPYATGEILTLDGGRQLV